MLLAGDIFAGPCPHPCPPRAGMVRVFLWTVSCALFPVVARQIWRMIEAAIQGTDDASIKTALRLFRVSTLLLWTCFPIIWCCVQCGWVDTVTEEILWSVCDVMGKVRAAAAGRGGGGGGHHSRS